MRKAITLIVILAAASPVAAYTQVYDGFDYPVTANLGRQVNPGLNLPWGKGSAGLDATIGSENLSVAGLPASTGNSVILSGLSTSNGIVDRISPGGAGAYGSGTLYYSLIFKVTDMAGLSTAETGMFFAGFNNSPPTATTGTQRACARLQMRTSTNDPTKFQLGIRTDQVTAYPSTIAWDTSRDFEVGQTIFVVAAYEFKKTAVPDPLNDDVARLWINPDAATFGQTSPPPTTLASTGSDISQLQIQSFFVRQADVGPTATIVDELRIGTNWADVTSNVGPPPPCNEPRFDLDGDKDVDQADFAAFQACFTGAGAPGSKFNATACRCVNSDGDLDIDGDDLQAFEACASGPGIAADAACDDALPPP